MRTTLTLDDDLFGMLQRRAKELEKSFKEVVNATLRAGLQQNLSSPPQTPPKVKSRNLGLKSGLDPDRLNQMVDELEAEAFARNHDQL